MSRKRVDQKNEINNNPVEFVVDEAKISMIQMLIPLGLEAIKEILLSEVESLAGKRYSHSDSPIKRWGSNPGSVYLGKQKMSLQVPRVRNVELGQEVPLQSYEALQESSHIDDSILAMVINGISCRKYEKAAEKIPESFGIKKTSVSNKFIKATAGKLRELLERDLSRDDIIAIFIDGKTFAENEIIVAMGVSITGDKKILGFVETNTENTKVIKEFLRRLVNDQGLSIENEMLFIIDGAKGLSKGIRAIFGSKAVIQRCQWHKRENIVSYLPKEQQRRIRKKLQDAYNSNSYEDAKSSLNSIKNELKLMNESAVRSLEEGFEETLTLHRLGLFQELGTSFKTTNCIESFNKQLEIYTSRVCNWKNSNQRQRWFATATLEIEPKLRKVKGHKSLILLRERMMAKKNEVATKKAA